MFEKKSLLSVFCKCNIVDWGRDGGGEENNGIFELYLLVYF